MQATRNYKCVFDTNSILEMRLVLYCPVFEEMKSSFFDFS